MGPTYEKKLTLERIPKNYLWNQFWIRSGVCPEKDSKTNLELVLQIHSQESIVFNSTK